MRKYESNIEEPSKALLEKFDANWQIYEGVPAIDSFNSLLDLLETPEPGETEPGEFANITGGLRRFAWGYRNLEALRYKDDAVKLERYHTHGIFTGYLLLYILKENWQTIQRITDGKFTMMDVFITVASGIAHDVGGETEGDKFATAVDKYINFLADDLSLGEDISSRIKEAVRFTDYRDEMSYVRFSFETGEYYIADNIPLKAALLPATDLIQVGANGYKKMVVSYLPSVDQSGEYRMPPVLALTTAKILNRLAKMLGKERALDLLTDDVQVRVYDVLTDHAIFSQVAVPVDSATGKPYDPVKLSEDIRSLLDSSILVEV